MEETKLGPLLEDLQNVLKRAFLNRGKVGNVFKSCDKMFQFFTKLLCDVSSPLLVFDFRVLRRSLWRYAVFVAVLMWVC